MGRNREQGNEKLGQYVQRRSGGALELRYPLPTDVRHAFLDTRGNPRTQITKSLGTSDVKIANAKADLMRASILAEISGIRTGRSSSTLGHFLHDLYNEELARTGKLASHDARNVLVMGSSDPLDARESDRTVQVLGLESGNPAERVALAGWAAERYFRNRGEDPRQAPDFQAVVDECALVLADALVAQNEITGGRPAPAPRSTLMSSAAAAASTAPNATSERGRLPISVYFADVQLPAIQNENIIRGQNTISGKAQAVDLLAKMLGDPPVGAITKSDLWRFHDLLLKLPNSREVKGEHRKLGPLDQIDAYGKGLIKAATLSPKTVNKHLSGIKVLLDFAEARHDIATSPSHGVKAKVVAGEESGRPFTTDELNRIFAQPLFAGCSEGLLPKGLQKPGPVLVRDDRFWIPLVLLFTGARPSEIAGLESADVIADHEVPHFLIRVNSVRGLKNPQSKRMVPIHQALISMGFLAFARDTARQTDGRFFPMAKQEYSKEKPTKIRRKKNLSSSTIMRQFNRTILADAKARDNDGSNKCFRNTFEQESSAKIGSDEVARRLTGRDLKSSVKIYTQNIPDDPIKRTAQLRRLQREINQVVYEGVELSHLTLGHAAGHP